jgi:hypothetical protein
MADHRMLIVHFEDTSTPKILSLRCDQNGYIAVGNRGGKYAIDSSHSWNALQVCNSAFAHTICMSCQSLIFW